MGQYIPVDSFIHRLDPRTKIIALLAFIPAIFSSSDVYVLMFLPALLFFVASLASLSVFFVLRGIRFFFWLLLFTALFHLFFTPGDSFYPFPILGIDMSRQGAVTGLRVFLQLFSVIVAANIFTLTTSPRDMVRGLEQLLSPLKFFGLKTAEAALMITLVIRFIPVLRDELLKVMKSQQARGVVFSEGSLVIRAKNLVAVIGPVFCRIFDRTETLVLAMTSRAYGSDVERGAYEKKSFKGRDALAFSLVIVFAYTLFVKY
ncbi:MAG: energy-coupling factor transporter transmembrane protein EcfT [Proteobacteria bacterium]|nr:energy-coupling factor transporter transmembrane protein EcfT [Pseudomonadota bacterium]